MKLITTLSLIILFTTISCTAQKQSMDSKIIPGKFAHTVYFWMKNPSDQSSNEAFLKSLRKFIDNCPYMITKHIGQPAPTDRDVIDNTYSYSLLLTFKNLEEQEKYQDDPNHKVFIAESSGLWSKVLVYDSILLE
ncbi:Stress responsive A/B Barrel Domain [Flavobacteriaceae bacterium MAR_2010_188]|nr:Stress responsive A/B Barrel Domain [Flavobacteriaceae bacterium MAR_2010_188]